VEYTGWSVYVRRPISHVQCRAHRYVLVHGVVVLGSGLGGAMALLGKDGRYNGVNAHNCRTGGRRERLEKYP
jgi:hypothetical protein